MDACICASWESDINDHFTCWLLHTLLHHTGTRGRDSINSMEQLLRAAHLYFYRKAACRKCILLPYAGAPLIYTAVVLCCLTLNNPSTSSNATLYIITQQHATTQKLSPVRARHTESVTHTCLKLGIATPQDAEAHIYVNAHSCFHLRSVLHSPGFALINTTTERGARGSETRWTRWPTIH